MIRNVILINSGEIKVNVELREADEDAVLKGQLIEDIGGVAEMFDYGSIELNVFQHGESNGESVAVGQYAYDVDSDGAEDDQASATLLNTGTIVINASVFGDGEDIDALGQWGDDVSDKLVIENSGSIDVGLTFSLTYEVADGSLIAWAVGQYAEDVSDGAIVTNRGTITTTADAAISVGDEKEYNFLAAGMGGEDVRDEDGLELINEGIIKAKSTLRHATDARHEEFRNLAMGIYVDFETFDDDEMFTITNSGKITTGAWMYQSEEERAVTFDDAISADPSDSDGRAGAYAIYVAEDNGIINLNAPPGSVV